jgi:hypothetical protein
MGGAPGRSSAVRQRPGLGRRCLSFAVFSGNLRRAAFGAGGLARDVLTSRAFVRGLKIFAGVFSVLALVSGVGFGALMYRLGQGPIEVNGLGKRVADALTRRFDGAIQVSFGSTQIARGAHGPTITVDRVLAVSAGRTVIEAPRAELSLDPIALLRFEALPRRFEIFDLTVRLLVMPDGALAMTAGGPNEEAIVLARPPSLPDEAPVVPAPADKVADAKPRRSAVIKEATDSLRAFFDFATSPRSPLAALHNVSVRGGTLVVDDRTAGRTTTFSQLEMSFEKNRRLAAFLLSAQGPNGKLSAHARAAGTPDTQRQLEIEVRDLSMDEIALVAGMRRFYIDSDANLSFKLKFVLGANRELREASGRAVIGAGFARLEDPDHEPVFFDEVSGGFHWDTANRRIVIDPVQYYGGETQFTVEGALDPPADADGGWRLALGLSRPGTIGPERPGDKPLQLDKASLDAKIFIEAKRVDIGRAEIAGPELAVATAGTFDWVNGARVRMGASTGVMPLRSVFRIWPTHMGAGARTWMLGHVHGGVLQSSTLSVDFDKDALLAMRFDRPPPDDSLQMDAKIASTSVTAMPGIPDVTNVAGSAHITGRSALFNATSATMETAPGRRLTMNNATFSMPRNEGAPTTPVSLETQVTGSVEAVADLLAKDAVKSYASLPLEPDSLKGQVDGKLKLDFAIGPGATGADVKVFVDAKVTNFVADRLIGKERFEAPQLIVSGTPNGIRATGDGKMAGAPAALDLRKDIGQPTTATLTATLDDSGRAKLGFSPSGVSGPLGVKVKATLDRDIKANVDLDLTKVALDNPVPGLAKPAGRPGRATFTAVSGQSRVRVEDLVAEAGGAMARGSLDFSSQGELLSAKLSQVRLSPGDDFRLDLQRSGDVTKIVAHGPTVDGRPFIRNIAQTSDANSRSEDFELDVKTPILTGYGKRALVNADIRIVRKGGTLRQFSATGQFGRAPFSASMSRGDNGLPQVNVSSADAGALLGFADLYSRMDGGALTASMQFGDRTLNGMLSIRSFQLRDEPALRRLVSEGNSRVDSSGAVRVDSSLVGFDRLQVLFSRSGGRLTLRDGVMNGPNIGLTVEGVIDNDRDTMALNGTFVPAYTVNNFFAKIPVVGMLLGGGWNEGLFAINYRVTGRPGNPQISVNPLTVAPGFLRKIFGAFDAVTAPQPEPNSGFATGASSGGARPAFPLRSR